MNVSADVALFRLQLAEFALQQAATPRILSFYSAAIAFADEAAMRSVLELAKDRQVPSTALYEIVLQSYLFLGFPRMLEAAELFHEMYRPAGAGSMLAPVSADESAEWFERGVGLCHRVYRSNYERLKDKVEEIAPEIFRWMVLEGYGKVLSRPGLPVIERELAIVACLTVENRPRQLHSHIRGALNVGAAPVLIRQVLDDVGSAAGDGYTTALGIVKILVGD